VYHVYIMSNNSMTLYTGVTNKLPARVIEHKTGQSDFTRRYHCTRLVYYEEYSVVQAALAREKQIKGWTRTKKIELVKVLNPGWIDLSEGCSTETRPHRSF
jgi:putative endonuclease